MHHSATVRLLRVLACIRDDFKNFPVLHHFRALVMPNQHQCRYCWRYFPTIPGLRGHISKKRSCRENRQRVLARLDQRLAQAEAGVGAVDDVEMEDGTDIPAESAHNICIDHGPIPPDPPAKTTASGPGSHAKVSRWVEAYPSSAGATKGMGETDFVKVQEQQRECNEDPWAPFESRDEWELAQWLLRNVGQNATDEFLKLPIVSSSDVIRDVFY